MAETLIINGGTYSDLTVGTGETYDSVSILGDGTNSGLLDGGSIISGGTVSVSSGGVASTITMNGNGATGGTLVISKGGKVDGTHRLRERRTDQPCRQRGAQQRPYQQRSEDRQL